MRLTRSRDDVIVSGVLAGLGKYFNVDPTLIRIGVAILIFFSPFPVIPLYIIGAVLIPKESKSDDKRRNRKSSKKKYKDFLDRDFEETNETKQHSSSKAKDVHEEDWSDF